MRKLAIVIPVCLLMWLSSCNKVIELDLRDTETKYVFEGLITNEPGSCRVYITQSRNFNQDNQFAKISGAVVSMKDNGVQVTLPETKPGTYETNLLTGIPGHT